MENILDGKTNDVVNKNYALSLIRILSMLLIISCHILQGLNIKFAFWVNVGVQLFFILSGYLYGTKQVDNVGRFYKDRLKKILVPYIILSVIIFIIEFAKGTGYSVIYIIGSTIGFGGTQGNPAIISHTWFITYILLCYLIIPMLQRVFNAKNFKTNLIRFLMVVIFLHLLEFYFVVRVNTCWIICFVFGYFFTKCCKKFEHKSLMYILAGIGFILIFPMAVILQEGLPVNFPSIVLQYSIYFINYGHVFLGVILFIALYNTFKFIEIKHNIVIDFLDKHSYYVYLTHQIFILGYFSLLFLTNYLAINILIILLVSMISAIILKLISDLVLMLIGKITQNLKNKKSQKG